MQVAINGFGRIGRNVLRAAVSHPHYGDTFEIVAINDLGDTNILAHLLKYDSIYGKFDGNISVQDNGLLVNGRFIRICSQVNPEKLPWNELNIDVVVESTGIFKTHDGASKHILAGAKKVIISAPAKDADVTIVLGVNEQKYNPEQHTIISNASCTTNSLAPVLKVLNDSFGIEKGFMTTIHSYTGDQRILDFPHKDYRRARAAATSIIPTTTGAAKAVGLVIPELQGKLDGLAIRVPTPDGSLTDFTCILKRDVTKEDVNNTLKYAAYNHLQGIMEYTEEPIVSVDIIGNDHSAIIDGLSTCVIGGTGNLIKVLLWYDNEWGYSCRVVDLINYIYTGKKHMTEELNVVQQHS